MTILLIKDLWKKTEHSYQLKDVSLAIYENEWLLITGPVNEGKEVLQNILLQFDEEFHGTVYFQNENIKKIKNYSEQVAFIHNHFTSEETEYNVYDYLSLPLKLKGFDEGEIFENIRKVTEEISCNLSFKKLIKDLSLREKVVVCLLRANLTKPKLLIIEEPFFELPNSKRQTIISVFKNFIKIWKQTTVIVFSSYASEWFEICDRVVLMKNYSISQIGEKKQLLQNPEQIFVTKYIDCTEVSYLKGCIKKGAFISDGLTFLLPQYIEEEFQIYEGQSVYIGLRASYFQIMEQTKLKDEGFTVSLPIHFFKGVDDRYMIYSNIGGNPVVAEIKNNGKIYEGQNLLLYYVFGDLLFFDGVTELNLKRRG